MDSITYPFSKSCMCYLPKLRIRDIPVEILDMSSLKENLFPDVIAKEVVFHRGPTKKQWNEYLADLLVWCIEHNVKKLYFCWNSSTYACVSIPKQNWREIIVVPVYWNPVEKYVVGCHISIGKSISKTLEMISAVPPYQVFLGNPRFFEPPTDQEKATKCKNIVREKGLQVYVHAPYVYNLSQPGLSSRIRSYLEAATAYGFLGVVFHVGKRLTMPAEVAIQNMEDNVLGAIDPSLGLCPLLLETAAGQGTEVLCNYDEFLKFSSKLFAIAKSDFGVCVDSCHVFSTGYCPYQYLKYVVETVKLPVRLVHFNDSAHTWDSRKDRHAPIGRGKIPWLSLEKMAAFASSHSIPMVTEY